MKGPMSEESDNMSSPDYEALRRRVRELEASESLCKQAEEALRESERRFLLAQRTARIGHVDYNIKTGETFWSHMVYVLYERDPALGPPTCDEVMSNYSPGEAETLKRLLSEAVTEGTPCALDLNVRLPSGRTAVYHVIGTPQKDEAGRVVSLSGTVQDVTDRKRAEEASERDRALFHGTFENAAVGMAHISPDGRLIRVNQQMCLITGYGRDELHEKSFQEITHPEDLQRDLDLTGRLIRGEIDHYRLEKRYIRKDGETVWIRLTASMQNEELGIGIIEDITERKATEQKLKESEERLRTIIDNSQDGIHQLDLASGKYVFMSPAQENLTGVTLEELNRLTMKKAASRLHPDDVPRVEAFFDRVARGEVPGEPMEYRWRVRSGEYRWISDRRSGVWDDSGNVVSLIGVSRDITEQKRMEDELRKSRDELELRVRERTAELEAESDRRKYLAKRLVEILEEDRQSLAMMLHDDVGQQLAGTKMELETVQDVLSAMDPALAGKIQHGVESIQAVIGSLRDASRQLRPGTLDILGLVAALRSLGDGLQTAACNIRFFFNEVPDSLSRDLEIAVFRIAQEAVTNAIRHSGCSEIQLSLSRRHHTLHLTVEDDGCGFSWDDRFSKASNRGPLGLVIMRERSVNAGGELRVESSPGKGTTVMAEFPLEFDA